MSKKERSKELAAAGLCWKAAANAVEHLNGSEAGLLIPKINRELEELRLTWLKRGMQFESSPVETKEAALSIQPAASYPDSPDPNRVAATAACSSTNLGNSKRCIGPAISLGNNQFAFKLKPGCSAGSIAAIRTLDSQGRCVRQVISLWPDNKLATVESYGEPSVLDAIAYRDGNYECYARRHENISCNGKIDYSAVQSTTTPVPPKEPLPQHEVRKKQKVEVTPQQSPVDKTKRKKRPSRKNGTPEATKQKISQKQASREPGMDETASDGGTIKKIKCYIFRKSCRMVAN